MEFHSAITVLLFWRSGKVPLSANPARLSASMEHEGLHLDHLSSDLHFVIEEPYPARPSSQPEEGLIFWLIFDLIALTPCNSKLNARKPGLTGKKRTIFSPGVPQGAYTACDTSDC